MSTADVELRPQYRGANAKSKADSSAATVLVVPGFVVDTYSEIEASYVELSARNDPELRFLWLVPDITAKDNLFVSDANRELLSEPVWVPRLRENGIPYVVGNIRRYNIIANLKLFRRLFREHRVDAVYTHFGFERFWATLLAKLWGKTTIWNEHWHSLGTKRVLFKRLFYRLFVDDFVAVSRFIGGTLPRAARVHVVHNAMRASGVPRAESRDEVRTRLDLPRKRPTILMVAAFRPEKRHGLALEICRQVWRENRDVLFVFLGEGPLRRAFLESVRAAGLERNIRTPGYVANVNDYYAAVDLCMLTSHNEPFGYCVLEAMIHELPVVAFETGGPGEVLQSGETGILIRDGDAFAFSRALLRLMGDGPGRRRMGEAARRAVETQFNRESWISSMRALLRQIIQASAD